MAGKENKQDWNVPIIDYPNIGEVWGIEGYGLEGREPNEWGLYVCFTINGNLHALGYATTLEVTDEVRAKAVEKLLKSCENSWLATVPDIFEFDKQYRPGVWVASWERRRKRFEPSVQGAS